MKINRNSLVIGAVLCAMRLAGQSAPEPHAPTAWETQLSANSVGAAQMQSFHQRAGQKLRDFADLLTLIAGPTMDEALRQESRAAAMALFSDKSAGIHWHGKQFPLESFLAQIAKSASGTQFSIAEFKGYPPGGCAQRNCTWEAVFYWVEKTPDGKSQQYSASMTVVLKKVKKQFGGQEKESWEVFLGEVR
jgi:hypothetical protein